MKKSSQIAWNIVPLRYFFPLKVVPLIEVLLYPETSTKLATACSTLAVTSEAGCKVYFQVVNVNDFSATG
jgi:hypothetical protein